MRSTGRGDTVVVRSDDDTPIVLRVWFVSSSVVWATTDKIYKKLVCDGDVVRSIAGIPRTKVFWYDPELATKNTADVPHNDAFWMKLRRYEQKSYP